jgi:hypothetical protein
MRHNETKPNPTKRRSGVSLHGKDRLTHSEAKALLESAIRGKTDDADLERAMMKLGAAILRAGVEL